jgi:thymidylate synthase
MFSIIVACDSRGGIAKNNKIPWKNEIDKNFFRSFVRGKNVVMGRKTYEDAGRMPGCCNFVVSRNAVSAEQPDQFAIGQEYWFDSLDKVVEVISEIKEKRETVVVGGESVYDWFLDQKLITNEIITFIPGDYGCDRFYSRVADGTVPSAEFLEESENTEQTMQIRCNRIKTEEDKMLSLMRKIYWSGNSEAKERTEVGTRKVFGEFFEFDLSNNRFPLMTTRRLPLRQIFEELIMYIRGQTDSKILENKKVYVWKANTTRSELNKRGLFDYEEGEMGHTYGFSMRHYGAQYVPLKFRTEETVLGGFDQLENAMWKIREDPGSRRIMINLWEPDKVKEAALPPCLYGYQFFVRDDVLDCKMDQRSSDFALAGGWNVATGALFLRLMAHYCGKKPGKLFWCLGDVHLYQNHMEQVKKQLERTPVAYPKLFLQNMPETIEEVEAENLKLVGYENRGFEPLRFAMNP